MKHIGDEQRDAILETSRKSMHRHVKRTFDKFVSCSKCKRPSVLSDKTISYLCRYCGKYNSADEAEDRYTNGDFIEPKDNFSRNIGAPVVKSSETASRDYVKLRDEYEIRSDLFCQGKTRDSMGVDNFNNTLRKELKKNNAYRGPEKSGV